MNRDRRLFLCVGLLMTGLVAPLLAQTTGSIAGQVRDEEGKPLAGVEVTARSPSLQGARTTSTDRDGYFRLPALPPGDYEVKGEREGFHPVEQTGVRVPIDREITLELRILPAFREEVTVVSAPPIIDVTGTTIGANVERTVIKELPTARTYLDLAFLAPGVVEGGVPGQPSINGSSFAENRYFVDGLDVTGPSGGTLTSMLPVEFVQQVEIKTGGYGPEYGGALGGIINAVTRSCTAPSSATTRTTVSNRNRLRASKTLSSSALRSTTPEQPWAAGSSSTGSGISWGWIPVSGRRTGPHGSSSG